MKTRNLYLRLIALLLISAFLFAAAACADNAEPAVTDTGSETQIAEETEPEVKDDLPETDYNGYVFNILTRDADHHIKEVYAVELNGEVVNDAVFARNRAVEERFNTEIKSVEVGESDESTLTRFITKSVMANDNAFDLALAHTVYAGAVALEGVLYNWHDMEYTDFSKPWWNSVLADELTVKGHLFLAVSDMCISAVDYTWVMVFNKDLGREYNVENLYDAVDSKTWTLDRFSALIKTIPSDLDGDGSFGLGDLYGFATHYNSAVTNWMFALDQKVTEADEDGYPIMCVNTDKMADIVTKMYDVMHEDNSTMFFDAATVTATGKSSHDTAVASFFAQNQTLIAALRLYVIEELRSMETDFGIIPFPMYDENQAGYYTHVDGHAPLMCLPKTLTDASRTSVIIEALSYESWKRVLPAVYDIVLESKYARDDESAAMLDIILGGRVYTFGYIYDDWKGMQWSLHSLVNSKKTDFASYYAKNEKNAQRQYDKVINMFEELF
ncbi:MAG: hypothetical protein PHZ09_08005 [Eubacteriales bacterium]|nr:hypothetical protein [Eubacteriales bacterium]